MLIDAYAEELSISLIRQACGYAYYGEFIPLRIQTTYAQLMIDKEYADFYSDIYGDYFADYESIFLTANTIDAEISAAVESFGLENDAGVILINWLSKDSAKQRFGKALVNRFTESLREIDITTIQGYLHEYYHHLGHLLNPDLDRRWQGQAFCEIGRAHSQYAQYAIEKPFTQNELLVELFASCTGRSYLPGLDDYYRAYDILCFLAGEYELDDVSGRNAMNSFCHYLIDLYGEETVYGLMLSPDSINDATGKTWDELAALWKQHIQAQYGGVEIPGWVSD